MAANREEALQNLLDMQPEAEPEGPLETAFDWQTGKTYVTGRRIPLRQPAGMDFSGMQGRTPMNVGRPAGMPGSGSPSAKRKMTPEEIKAYNNYMLTRAKLFNEAQPSLDVITSKIPGSAKRKYLPALPGSPSNVLGIDVASIGPKKAVDFYFDLQRFEPDDPYTQKYGDSLKNLGIIR